MLFWQKMDVLMSRQIQSKIGHFFLFIVFFSKSIQNERVMFLHIVYFVNCLLCFGQISSPSPPHPIHPPYSSNRAGSPDDEW